MYAASDVAKWIDERRESLDEHYRNNVLPHEDLGPLDPPRLRDVFAASAWIGHTAKSLGAPSPIPVLLAGLLSRECHRETQRHPNELAARMLSEMLAIVDQKLHDRRTAIPTSSN